MDKQSKLLYEQPEEYKSGWVHGFYDAKHDDGAFYGTVPNDINGIEETRMYDEGYRDGQAARLRNRHCSVFTRLVDETLALNPS